MKTLNFEGSFEIPEEMLDTFTEYVEQAVEMLKSQIPDDSGVTFNSLKCADGIALCGTSNEGNFNLFIQTK